MLRTLYLTALREYNFHPRDPRSKLHPRDPRRQQSQNNDNKDMPKFEDAMSEAAKAVADKYKLIFTLLVIYTQIY